MSLVKPNRKFLAVDGWMVEGEHSIMIMGLWLALKQGRLDTDLGCESATSRQPQKIYRQYMIGFRDGTK